MAAIHGARIAKSEWTAGASSPYTRREIVHWPGWGKTIAWDVFLNNLSAGLFVATMVGYLLAPADWAGIAMLALPLALLIALVDLGVLVLDLGDPWRFLHMLRVFRRLSPMSVGTWSLSLYAPLLALASGVELLRWPWFSFWQAGLATMGTWPALVLAGKAAATLALLPALGVLLYKGVLFSCTSQPGLRDARWLAAYLASSSLRLGAATLLLLAVATNHAAAIAGLRPALIGLLALAVLTGVQLARDVGARAQERYSVAQLLAVAAGPLVGGVLLPLVLLAASAAPNMLVAAAVLVLAAELWVRHVLILLASPRPAV